MRIPVTASVTLTAIAEDSGARLIIQAELLANTLDVDGPSLSAVNLQIAKLAGKPLALIMNAAPTRDGQAVAAGEEAGRDYGAELCPIVIHQRAVFSHALARSQCAQEVEPTSKAAAEVAALWVWLAQRASLTSSPVRLSA